MGRLPALLLAASIGATIRVPLLAGDAIGPRGTQKVTVGELEGGSAVIIGGLGRPLCVAVEVEATVEEELSPFIAGQPTGNYLLRVEKIEGKKVERPPAIRFRLPATGHAALAENTEALEVLLRALPAYDADYEKLVNPNGTLFLPKVRTPDEVKAFRNSYVGSRHRLVVYEALEYDGLPANRPPDCPPWTVGQKRVMSWLVVMAERRL